MDSAPANADADEVALASRLRQRIRQLLATAAELRRWTMASRKRSAVVVTAATVLVGLTVVVWVLLARRVAEPEVRVLMHNALEAVDDNRFSDALHWIEQIRRQQALPAEEFGGPAFVRGAVKAHEAGGIAHGERRQSAYLVAAKYFQEARSRGFPPGREADGLWLLGKSLIEARQFAEAVPVLEEALQHNPRHRTALHRMLTLAHLRAVEPNLVAAERHTALELSDRTLPPHERAEALLRRGDILLRLGRTSDVRDLVEQLPTEIRGRPAAQMLQARLLMGQAEELGPADPLDVADEKPDASDQQQQKIASVYQAAIATLRNLQATAEPDGDLSRVAMYLIGQCYARLPGETDAALEQFSRLRKLHASTAEGIAASFAEAELLRWQARIPEAVSAYQRTLVAVGDPDEYYNPWLSLPGLKKDVLAALDSLLGAGEFEAALLLLDQFPPAFDPVTTLWHRAQAREKWGRHLLQWASMQTADDGRRLARQARSQFRRAAVLYEQLSELRIVEREYPDDLWQAAENYIEGHSFSHAVRMLQKYLLGEANARRPQALVKLGEAYLAQGDIGRCIAALQECIELHNQDAAVYAARLLAARAYKENSETQKAEQLLRANLTDNGLTPQSREWRESLLELGKLYHSKGAYEEAIPPLREYVERYDGEEPDSLVARYLAAQSYRHAARGPLDKLRAALTENERLKHRTQAEELLSAATGHFLHVQRTLTLKGAQSPLDPLEQAILRNCYLLRGDILFSLREYEKALEVYRNASSLYQHDPIVLGAYLQIASCHRRLGQLQEARGAIEQARIILSRLPEQADFALATGFDRLQWNRVLNDMSQWK